MSLFFHCSDANRILCSKFAVDHENVRGAWVQSSTNQSTYVLGRIGFSPEERARYGILSAKVAEVNVGFVLLEQQVGALEFPAASGIDGYIVGLSVESCWTDGTNGWWCIGNQLQLGAKQAKIEVKTEGSRGMHVCHCFSRDMLIQIADFVVCSPTVAFDCVLYSEFGVRRVGTSLTPTREHKNSLFDCMGVAELYDTLAGVACFTLEVAAGRLGGGCGFFTVQMTKCYTTIPFGYYRHSLPPHFSI